MAVFVANVSHHLTLSGELHPTVFTGKRLDSKVGVLMVQQGLFSKKAFGTPTAFELLLHVSPHVLH